MINESINLFLIINTSCIQYRVSIQINIRPPAPARQINYIVYSIKLRDSFAFRTFRTILIQ